MNLIGAFMMSREAAPHIGPAGGGEIIMTSSIASMTANGSSIAYCASKAGMNSLTRTLAKTLGKQKIRVNAVLPGLIDGDWAFNTWGGGDAEQYDAKKMFADQPPLGHVVTPTMWLTRVSLITGSDYVTGQLVTLVLAYALTFVTAISACDPATQHAIDFDVSEGCAVRSALECCSDGIPAIG
ncbi:MAG: hypothetical protein CM15mP74_05360 [Halieaceae bacterium]|nr:MAG: hypothetical protein CM15mP74_05360 [Halieaceae bacterium]